jgi:hypothetical protein
MFFGALGAKKILNALHRILEKVKGQDFIVSKSPTSGNPFNATTGSLS